MRFVIKLDYFRRNKTEKNSVKDHEALNGLNITLKSLGVSSRLLETE